MPKSRKIPFRFSLALCLIAGFLFASSWAGIPAGHSAQVSLGRQQGADRPHSFLERLYIDHRYFELRDAVESTKDVPDPELEFYKGAVDDVFKRLESAVAHLRSYFEGGQAAGRDLALKKVRVHTEVTHSITDVFDGTIGRDVLTQWSRMTFNFESMSFVLE